MYKKPLFILHIAVFLFGFTAILGKLLSIQAYSLVWWRMMIAAALFMLLPGFWKKFYTVTKNQRWLFLGIGILVAIHWLTFYGSIKVGDSASLTLACFGLTASFTSVIEPLLLKQKIKGYELFLGLIAFAGIFLIYKSAPGMNMDVANVRLAIILGVVSSFLAALFSSLNAKHIKNADPVPVTFLELTGGFIFTTIYFWINPSLQFEFLTNGYDWLWMLLLTVVCTNLAFVLNLEAMKKVSAFTANIAINLEPIYGIILAAAMFSENKNLNFWFYIGAAIILTTVFLHPLMNKIMEKRRIKHEQNTKIDQLNNVQKL